MTLGKCSGYYPGGCGVKMGLPSAVLCSDHRYRHRPCAEQYELMQRPPCAGCQLCDSPCDYEDEAQSYHYCGTHGEAILYV
jgi:hypothetical protein